MCKKEAAETRRKIKSDVADPTIDVVGPFLEYVRCMYDVGAVLLPIFH